MRPVSNQLNRFEAFDVADPGTEFTVKTTAKAFKILSSTLYADKIEAIVREISCNARDSMIAAGRGEFPFVVQTPSFLEQDFFVEDTGTGLSEHDIRTIFTTYFESTKGDSNDFIGTMGLGSKSPFSYTDQFTVISRYAGDESTYVCSLGQAGTPTLIKVDSFETTERNGVKIVVPVKDCDAVSFQCSARKILQYFDCPFILNGQTFNRGSFFEEPTELIEEINGYIKQNVRYSSSAGVFALMGGVSYPISLPAATSALGTNETRLVNLMNCISSGDFCLVLNFEIGQLDVAASREALSYDKVTASNVIERINSVRAWIIKELFNTASEITNMYAWRQFMTVMLGYHDIHNNYSVSSRFIFKCGSAETNSRFTDELKQVCPAWHGQHCPQQIRFEGSDLRVIGKYTSKPLKNPGHHGKDTAYLYLNDFPNKAKGIAHLRKYVRTIGQDLTVTNDIAAYRAQMWSRLIRASSIVFEEVVVSTRTISPSPRYFKIDSAVGNWFRVFDSPESFDENTYWIVMERGQPVITNQTALSVMVRSITERNSAAKFVGIPVSCKKLLKGAAPDNHICTAYEQLVNAITVEEAETFIQGEVDDWLANKHPYLHINDPAYFMPVLATKIGIVLQGRTQSASAMLTRSRRHPIIDIDAECARRIEIEEEKIKQKLQTLPSLFVSLIQTKGGYWASWDTHKKRIADLEQLSALLK